MLHASGGSLASGGQHAGLGEAVGSLDPDIVHFMQRNARSSLERRRYERLRKTTTKMQVPLNTIQLGPTRLLQMILQHCCFELPTPNIGPNLEWNFHLIIV